jgi:hypothetical protein
MTPEPKLPDGFYYLLICCPVITVVTLCAVALCKLLFVMVRLARYLMRAFRPKNNQN